MRAVEIESLDGQTIDLTVEDEMYIAGRFESSQETFEAVHPPTEEHIIDVPVANEQQINKAVDAAKTASETWRETPVMERRRRVERLADKVAEVKDELAALDVADNGSCYSTMQTDMDVAEEGLRYFAGLATELKGQTIPTGDDTLDYTVREPYGVVGSIIPFNHPAMFVFHRIAPAVISGNGIVLKPSEYTSLSALYVGRLIVDLDIFPDGLVNIVTGPGKVGAGIVDHRDVRMITMIGSDATAKKIMASASSRLANLLFECGGKNPVIVFPDADVSAATDGAVEAMALSWQGQSCGSGTRLLVHEDVKDQLVSRLVDRLESIDIGDPFDTATEMGSIVSKQQLDRVTDYIDIAREEGADLVTGGDEVDVYGSGHFVEPTVFDVEPEMRIAQEEVFGPVLSVITWENYEEMIEIVNDIRYGLTASVWTSDISTAINTVNDVEAGYVWVNHHGPHYFGAPFGGYKESGFGRKECFEELLDHTQVKNINIKIDSE